MTFKELKDKLLTCEKAIKCLQNGTYKDMSKEDIQARQTKLNSIKENILKEMKLLKEAVEFDNEKDAAEFADKNPETPVKIVKEAFSIEETKAIAKKVGKAVAMALKTVGDAITSMKAIRVEENSFEIKVLYKNGSSDEFSFYISEDKLHLVDFTFDKELVDVGVKPSGEPIVHVDVLSNALVNHFKEVKVDETKGAPKGHYFTKSGNLVKGRLTKDARERGARLSDPKDKQRSKIPPVTQYNKQEAVVNESRGAFDMCVRAIQDIAADGDISEREAAMEMMIAISDKYDFDMAGLESQLFHGDDSINEGRRAKSKGGKVVTEMDYDTGGYVEAMGPMFERACKMLMMAWEEWKNGPMTEPGMIEHAKKDIIDYLDNKLEEDILQEKKGKDHDGDGDVDSDDYMAARDKAIKKAMGKEKVVKENIKSIIKKVLEEGVIKEAATKELANMADTYGGFEGMKQAIIALQDVVTDIESYYDKTRTKIQRVYDTLGDIKNEEGLKVGGFLAPAIEQAFNKDLRPAIKGGFTKGLDQPKIKMISKRDIDMHNSGERPLGEEEKQTVEKDLSSWAGVIRTTYVNFAKI